MAMTPPFLVRRLQPDDAEAVEALARSLGKWFDAEGLRRMARDLASPQGYVASEGARPVGFLLWKPLDASVAELCWMGVAEDRHRCNIGSTLLARLVADAMTSGFRFLEVSTVADNVEYEPYEQTRRFYRARGFLDFRVDPQYGGSGEDRYDRLVLRRDLATRTGTARTNAGAGGQIGCDPLGQSQVVFKPA